MNAAVLTVSDGVHQGTREDRSGDTLAELLTGACFEVVRRIVPDDAPTIAKTRCRDVRSWIACESAVSVVAIPFSKSARGQADLA